MPIVLKNSGIAVSGTLVEVLDTKIRGLRDLRVFIHNAGGEALTACKVRVKDAQDGIAAEVDASTFASLGAGAAKSIVVEGPVEWLDILATCANGTELDVSVTDGPKR